MIHCSGQNFSSTIRQGVLCNYDKTADSVPAPEDDTSVGHFGTDVRAVPLSLLYLWLSAERCMLLCADLEGLGAGCAGGRERRAFPYRPGYSRPALSHVRRNVRTKVQYSNQGLGYWICLCHKTPHGSKQTTAREQLLSIGLPRGSQRPTPSDRRSETTSGAAPRRRHAAAARAAPSSYTTKDRGPVSSAQDCAHDFCGNLHAQRGDQ